MTMTNDELRALADALDEAMFKLLAAKRTEESESCERAADYLRAQADAQPVAAGWKWVPVEPTQAMNNAGLSAVNQYGKRSVWETYAAMLAAAPAAPQAEPVDRCRSSETSDPKATGRSSPERPASNREDAAAMVAAGSGEQAEPKRDWSAIDAAIREYLDGYEQIGENDAGADACYTPTERERDLIYDAINGLLADESFVAAISTPQAEPKEENNVWKQIIPDDVPQAEPKREPLTLEQIDSLIERLFYHLRYESNRVLWEHAVSIVRAVEHAHGIGGGDAE